MLLKTKTEVPSVFSSSWFRRVVKSDPVLHHPLLKAARAQALSREHLKLFAVQESFVSLAFPAMMAEVVARIPYTLEAVRYPLITNMFEEVGERSLNESHPALLRRLAGALGAADHEISTAQPLLKTKQYLDALFSICRDSSYLRALGAIGYGNEYLVLFEYPPFREATRAVGCPEEVLRFFDVNIEADATHTVNLERALAHACTGPGDVEAIYDGMMQSLAARNLFYDGLWEQMSGTA